MFKLFIYPGCPYCIKVQTGMNELNLEENKDFKLVDGHIYSHELIKLGGKQQVPFLQDGKTLMYESDDILEYLQQKFSEKPTL